MGLESKYATKYGSCQVEVMQEQTGFGPKGTPKHCMGA
jgi:hypothetical protein